MPRTAFKILSASYMLSSNISHFISGVLEHQNSKSQVAQSSQGLKRAFAVARQASIAAYDCRKLQRWVALCALQPEVISLANHIHDGFKHLCFDPTPRLLVTVNQDGKPLGIIRQRGPA